MTRAILIPEHLYLQEVPVDLHLLHLLVNSGGSCTYGIAVPFLNVSSYLAFICVVYRIT
jgi:hypothetical protein